MVSLVCVHINYVDKLLATSSPFKVICQIKRSKNQKTTVQRSIKINYTGKEISVGIYLIFLICIDNFIKEIYNDIVLFANYKNHTL